MTDVDADREQLITDLNVLANIFSQHIVKGRKQGRILNETLKENNILLQILLKVTI